MGLQHTAYLWMFMALGLRLVEGGTTRVRCTEYRTLADLSHAWIEENPLLCFRVNKQRS